MKQFFNNINSIIIMAAIIIIGCGTAGCCWEKLEINTYASLRWPVAERFFYGEIFNRIKRMNTTTYNNSICKLPALSVSGNFVVSIAAAIIISIIIIAIIIISIITSSGTA